MDANDSTMHLRVHTLLYYIITKFTILQDTLEYWEMKYILIFLVLSLYLITFLLHACRNRRLANTRILL